MTDREGERDYLVDKVGEPDPFVAALERKLAPLSAAQNPSAPPNVDGIARDAASSSSSRPRLRALQVVTTLGAVAVAAAVVVVVVGGPKADVITVRGDGVHNGAPIVDGARVTGTIVAEGRVDIDLGDHGVVTLDKGARVRVVDNDKRRDTLALDVGHLSAIVTAPPEFFSVVTPTVKAVDQGCIYTLDVGADGATRVAVTSGAVILRPLDPAEPATFVLAGASALTKPNAPPGLPYRTATSFALAAAAEAEDIPRVLELATDPRDAITVWNVVMRDPKSAAAVEAWRRVSTVDPHDVKAMYDALDAIGDALTPPMTTTPAPPPR